MCGGEGDPDGWYRVLLLLIEDWKMKTMEILPRSRNFFEVDSLDEKIDRKCCGEKEGDIPKEACYKRGSEIVSPF